MRLVMSAWVVLQDVVGDHDDEMSQLLLHHLAQNAADRTGDRRDTATRVRRLRTTLGRDVSGTV
jgi:hypothetical protein